MPDHPPQFWVGPTGHMPSEILPQTWGVPPPCLSWVVVGGSRAAHFHLFSNKDLVAAVKAERLEDKARGHRERQELIKILEAHYRRIGRALAKQPIVSVKSDFETYDFSLKPPFDQKMKCLKIVLGTFSANSVLRRTTSQKH